ncbi:MAG: MBL fold metallo-hydrolase [Candidatus Symbiothrix sp.]|jgi:glyoxylase-like metal-dependent hydrolase (beta-lactamase superfamily II)|nr:MBL fold metallo-hydrolase [Candidatus Symbiothrix sp.]
MRIIVLILMTALMPLVSAQNEQTVISFRAGDCTVSVLSEGGGQGNAGLLKGATPEQLQKYLPDGAFSLQTQVFLVRTPEQNILIDAGHGKNLFANLQSLALEASQIDVILLTHMHGDHIGGLLRDGKTAFPNAELYIAQAEYDFWNNNGDRGASQRKIFEIYKEKLHLFVPAEIENVAHTPEIVKGISAVAAYGHTPGHTAYQLQSAGEKWLIWGDLTHALPIQMPCPEVALSFDTDTEKAIASRKKLLEYIVGNRITAGGMHVPFPAIGTLKRQGDGYAFSPICLCEGI